MEATDKQQVMIRSRAAEFQANPSIGLTWDQLTNRDLGMPSKFAGHRSAAQLHQTLEGLYPSPGQLITACRLPHLEYEEPLARLTIARPKD